MGDANRALVITDHLFTDELADLAMAPLEDAGWSVERVAWAIGTIEDQRAASRTIENEGPNALPGPDALATVHDYRVVVTQFAPVGATSIANGRGLELIAINRAGLQNLDVAAAADRGIEVFNVPGRNANAVAEHTVGLMIAHLRSIAAAHAALKRGDWLEEFGGPGPRELAEVEVGLVGLGRIGTRVAELLAPFGCVVRAYDPHVDPSEVALDLELVDLDALMARSDVVSIHVPLSDETRGLVTAGHLGLLGPTGVLVNTARAEVVDQAALRQAVQQGTIAGAALDVFDTEPLPADDPLVTSPRTTLTPHLAGTTRQAFRQGPIWIADRLGALAQAGAAAQRLREFELGPNSSARTEGE